MNIKSKLIVIFIFISIIILASITLKNQIKTKFYLLTSKKELALGNLIAITFISGFTFSSTLGLITKNNLDKSSDNNINNEDEFDKYIDKNITDEFQSDRPPERDVRESQPTISVNYRFVDQESDSYTSQKSQTKNNNLRNNSNWLNNDEDWLNNDKDW